MMRQHLIYEEEKDSRLLRLTKTEVEEHYLLSNRAWPKEFLYRVFSRYHH